MLSFDAVVEIGGIEPAAVVVNGNLSAATTRLLLGAAFAAMDHAASCALLLDLRGVPEIDAEGMEALLDLQRAVMRRGRTLEVLGTSSSIEEALSMESTAALVQGSRWVEVAPRSWAHRRRRISVPGRK